MSKLPVSNTRVSHGSPPVKNRKALSNITEVINSPTFSKHSTLNKEISNRPTLKIETRKQNLPKTSIPSGNFSLETMQKVRSFSLAASKLESKTKGRSSSQSNVFDTSSMRDPAAIKKQQEMEERFEKYVEVQRQKLEELNRQTKESNEKLEELTRSKNTLTRTAIDFKSKIADAEVNIINMDHKLELLEKSVEKTITHEEQMNTVRLKEEQNILIRELDEFKGMLNQELQHAQVYKDDESTKEISKLEEESNHLSLTLNSLEQATKERLNKEVELLEKELEKIVVMEESKGEALAKQFEEKTISFDELKSKVEGVLSKVDIVKSERKALELEAQEQLDSQSTYKNRLAELERQIQETMSQNDEFDAELHMVTQECESVTSQYEEAHSKIEKEKKLRRRIENSIQELQNKLRVYTRVLDHGADDHLSFKINQQDDEERQNLTIGEQYYIFDKVFSPEFNDDEISDEIVCLTENNLNGANVSIVMTGHEENILIHQLLKTTMINLNQREEKYKHKQWNFSYSIQYLSITTQGVVDLISGEASSIRLENRRIQTDCKSVTSLEEVKDINPPTDASTLILIDVCGSNPHKKFHASTYLMNLSTIKSSDLILHAVTKVREGKFSSSEFSESPIYQLIHFLYSNTKVLTLVNLSNSVSNLEENENLLNLASFIHQTNSTPVNRVYSMSSK